MSSWLEIFGFSLIGYGIAQVFIAVGWIIPSITFGIVFVVLGIVLLGIAVASI